MEDVAVELERHAYNPGCSCPPKELLLAAAAEVRRLRKLAAGLVERVFLQSELLTARAMRADDDHEHQ